MSIRHRLGEIEPAAGRRKARTLYDASDGELLRRILEGGGAEAQHLGRRLQTRLAQLYPGGVPGDWPRTETDKEAMDLADALARQVARLPEVTP